MKVNIAGIRYHVDKCGEGHPLLLLHGFTGDSSTWNPYCALWGRHSELIIPDIIGHGKTEAPDGIDRYKIESAAADLKQILDQLGVKRVDLLGYSMGGRLALTFAILFPDRVRKLILASTTPGLEKEEDRQLRRMKDSELAKFIKDQGIQKFVEYWESIPLFASMASLPSQVKESIRDQRLSNSQLGLANSLLGMGTGSQPSWWGQPLEGLGCEVLIVTGEKDKKFCEIAERMLGFFRKGKWTVIKNAGHAIHVEEKEKFGTIVSDFLIKGGVSFDSRMGSKT